jgi:signal peptidase II
MSLSRKIRFSRLRFPASFYGGLLIAFVVGILYVLDRATKYFVTSTMSEGETFPVAEGVFHITLVHNTGGAFGVMKGQPHLFTATAFLFTVAAFMYTVFRWAAIPFREKAAFCLLIGGALGNLSDRMRLGYVVDFLDFRVWPVFNVADSCISLGAAILIFSLFFPPREKEKRCTE